jgi:hypothetical protein
MYTKNVKTINDDIYNCEVADCEVYIVEL